MLSRLWHKGGLQCRSEFLRSLAKDMLKAMRGPVEGDCAVGVHFDQVRKRGL